MTNTNLSRKRAQIRDDAITQDTTVDPRQLNPEAAAMLRTLYSGLFGNKASKKAVLEFKNALGAVRDGQEMRSDERGSSEPSNATAFSLMKFRRR